MEKTKMAELGWLKRKKAAKPNLQILLYQERDREMLERRKNMIKHQQQRKTKVLPMPIEERKKSLRQEKALEI
ncbi:Oidioi.mRNA.OKI2018_I69.XSR.g16981.t1.cds [Oikopleura dioica]|uniref:Oidioi.mRNA.OKI2018_I69.XSR.g16981.t1.cds n=1 Tax=Oikopleura dioica TaxID=34765 RepID=A0ABN7SHS5_OIKDI|nr:Oidioi.mRNA.OKI2018_I69.XSR.g16981.t1.cds [Oikopleura dioica]